MVIKYIISFKDVNGNNVDVIIISDDKETLKSLSEKLATKYEISQITNFKIITHTNN
jgi:hypothetical protein